jgi:hypothetical protein
MNKVVPSEYARDLLEAIEQDPDVTQASLARRLGVAVGLNVLNERNFATSLHPRVLL